jgi:hypothetical protein
MNKVLKMDFKGQTTVLPAIFVLVGMMILVPATTEKALAIIHATATGTCGIATNLGVLNGIVHPCEFSLMNKKLIEGVWRASPTQSGTRVGWDTAGSSCAGNFGCPAANEEGWVLYKVGGGEAKLHFNSPAVGSNKCDVEIVSGKGPDGHGLTGTCYAGPGNSALFTYTLHSENK